MPDTVTALHLPFGTVLGPDGRPFKTREGSAVRLVDLLAQAVDRARAVITEKKPGLNLATIEEHAGQIGIGAVKYADLSTSRSRDYTFESERMVSLTGNTGVYLQPTPGSGRSSAAPVIPVR